MSGLDWVKVYVDLPGHRKSLELAVELDDERAWTHMVELMLWVGKNAPTGIISGRSVESLVERAAGWRGKRGRFVEAALAVGFLERAGESIVYHGWDEEQGAHVAKAERDRERAAQKRREASERRSREAATNPATNADDQRATTTQPSPGVAGESRDGRATVEGGSRVERERERERTTSSPSGRGAADAGPPPPEEPVQEALVEAPAAPERPKRPRPTAVTAAFGEWVAADRAKRLPPTAPRDVQPGPHVWAALAELLRDHGRKAAVAAWLAFAEDPGALDRGLPVALFAAQWPRWVQEALRSGRVEPPAALQGPANQLLPETDAGRAWGRLLDVLHQEGARYAAATLRQLAPIELAGGRLVVEAGNRHLAAWTEEHYRGLLDSAGGPLGLRVAVVVAESGTSAEVSA